MMDLIVSVEAVGVEGHPDPRPPNRHEERGEPADTPPRHVVGQRVGQLGDDDDEYEVVEQLQPRRVARTRLRLRRPQAGRAKEARTVDGG